MFKKHTVVDLVLGSDCHPNEKNMLPCYPNNNKLKPNILSCVKDCHIEENKISNNQHYSKGNIAQGIPPKLDRSKGKPGETCNLEYIESVLNKNKLLISSQHKKLSGNKYEQIESLLSTNINTDRGYNTQEPVTDYANLVPSQSHISQVTSSSKIKQVTPTPVKPKSVISKIISINAFITEKLRILYTLWKIPVIIKKCFNEFHDHDRKVEPDNDDFSRNDLSKLLFGHLLSKQELSSEDDVHTTFDLLSFDTLNKVYLPWYDEKEEIDQAKIEKIELKMN